MLSSISAGANISQEQDKHPWGPVEYATSGFFSFLSSGFDSTSTFSTTWLDLRRGGHIYAKNNSSIGQSNISLGIQIWTFESAYVIVSRNIKCYNVLGNVT